LLPKSHVVNRLSGKPIALTIAGLDPSGGAGATADVSTMATYGVLGITAVTALTVQSSHRVLRVLPVEPGFLGETLACLGENFQENSGEIAGVKVGMLATAGNLAVVAGWLRASGLPRERVVLDPVIRSSSGAELLEVPGVRRLVSDLLPLVGWITPNLDELGALAGAPVPGRDEIPAMARKLAEQIPGLNVVATGGHLDSPDDFLLEADGQETWFPGRRVEASGIHGAHGTGCVFSTALLCGLILGDDPQEAVRRAKASVVRRLEGEE
jgi:hydroxymethylpyrimidine/phosphomethylpyrimidine kinase